MNLSNACQNLMEEEKNILSIILSGSRARGDFKKDSDYDLLFVTKSKVKCSLTEYEIIGNYRKKIAKQTAIDKELITVYLWPIKYFKKEHKKGNSFVYCALRDGKMLSSRYNLNLKQPNNCQKAAIDRMDLAKKNIECLELFLKKFRRKEILGLWLQDLGYCSMHICWAVCMFNNFCPVSKYTILQECREYFTSEEFKTIRKAYNFYADRDYRRIRKKTFMTLFNNLKSVIKRVELTFGCK